MRRKFAQWFSRFMGWHSFGPHLGHMFYSVFKHVLGPYLFCPLGIHLRESHVTDVWGGRYRSTSTCVFCGQLLEAISRG